MNLPGKFSESNFPVPLNFSFSPLNKNSDSFVTKLNWECFTKSNEYLPNKRGKWDKFDHEHYICSTVQ